MDQRDFANQFEFVLDDLASTVARLALQTVSIQKIFDRAASEEFVRGANVQEWPEELRKLQPKAGPRLLIRDFSIDCAVEVETTLGKRLMVGVLGATFSKLSKKRDGGASRLRIEVQVVPRKKEIANHE